MFCLMKRPIVMHLGIFQSVSAKKMVVPLLKVRPSLLSLAPLVINNINSRATFVTQELTTTSSTTKILSKVKNILKLVH